MGTKLGFSDRRTTAPKDLPQLVKLLGEIMSSAINNEVDLDNARVALNAATRMIDAIQADTRMKAVAIATQRTIRSTDGWALIDSEKQVSSDN